MSDPAVHHDGVSNLSPNSHLHASDNSYRNSGLSGMTVARPYRESGLSVAQEEHAKGHKDLEKETAIPPEAAHSDVPHSKTSNERLLEDGNVDPEHRRRSRRGAIGAHMKHHWKRFWWAHLIFFLICVMIVTLCLAYLAVPAIAQHDLNNSNLVLVSQIAVNPTPNSVELQMITLSQSDSTYHPRINPFRAALFLEDTEPNIQPFAYLNIPSITSGSNVTVYIQQTLDIIDLDQFSRYNLRIFQSEEYRVALRADISLKEQAFPTAYVSFNKVVTSKGLNGLQGVQIQNIQISSTGSLSGQVLIPNPSPITFALGTVTQDIYVDGIMIGTSTINNLVLQPGDNVYNMTSTSDGVTVLGLVQNKYTNGKLPIMIVGNSVVYNGAHLTYYEYAMQNNPIYTTLDLGPALSALGVNITSS